jgi:prepilin-type N-terminal cleavage/methylation domain-containing protein
MVSTNPYTDAGRDYLGIAKNKGPQAKKHGFTLVELLAVIAVISVLVGLLLPAVQAARESSRRTSCINNLHNHVAALSAYHSSHRMLPPGRVFGLLDSHSERVDFSWVAYVLPHIEQASLYSQIDFREPWFDPRNRPAITTPLELFRCPSSELIFPGDSDYAGILGTAMNTKPNEVSVDGPVLDRGVLINAERREEGIRFAQVTDGLSNTLAVSEAADFPEEEDGFWATGLHCISHDSGPVNSDRNGIVSWHPNGACGARADGSVTFITEDVAPEVIGALCTRAADDLLNPN